jgi:hypothetical protein
MSCTDPAAPRVQASTAVPSRATAICGASEFSPAGDTWYEPPCVKKPPARPSFAQIWLTAPLFCVQAPTKFPSASSPVAAGPPLTPSGDSVCTCAGPVHSIAPAEAGSSAAIEIAAASTARTRKREGQEGCDATDTSIWAALASR